MCKQSCKHTVGILHPVISLLPHLRRKQNIGWFVVVGHWGGWGHWLIGLEFWPGRWDRGRRVPLLCLLLGETSVFAGSVGRQRWPEVEGLWSLQGGINLLMINEPWEVQNISSSEGTALVAKGGFISLPSLIWDVLRRLHHSQTPPKQRMPYDMDRSLVQNAS